MKSPAARGLASLALACAAAELAARGLSSGTGQALLAPGSVIVLDAIGTTAALAALGARFLEREPGLVPDRGVLLPLGAFLGLALEGALRGANGAWRLAFSWAALAAFGLAVRDLARRRDVARALAGTLVGVATAASLLGLFDLFVTAPKVLEEVKKGHYPPEFLYRAYDPMATGPFLLPNHLGCALGMAGPLALATLFAFRRDKVKGPLAAVLVVVLALGIGFARSKGAVLALLVGLLVFFALAVESREWRKRLVLGVAGVLSLSLLIGVVKYARHPDQFGVGLSSKVRLEYWQAALRMAEERPLAGNGLECYAELFSSHKAASAEETRHAHLDLLELLAELGVAGPAAFVWLVFALGRSGVRALRAPRAPPPYEAAYAPGAIVTLGVALGVLVLGAHGDLYDSSRSWELVFGATVATLVGALVARALEDPENARRGAAACLAGALVFVVDGFTDFPLRVHGLVAFALALAFLAPALAEGPSAPTASPPAKRIAVAVPLVALLLFGLYRVHEDVSDDALRLRAREEVADGLALLRSNQLSPERRREAELALGKAAAELRSLLESNQLSVSEVLLLLDAQERECRLAHDEHRFLGLRLEIEDALRRFPRSRELWSALGRLDGESNLLEDATAAFDEAARCYPTNPHVRLDAAVIRVARIAAGETDEKLRRGAAHELRAALACALASRLERLHLTDAEVAAARGFLVALGEEPVLPGREEPEPPVR